MKISIKVDYNINLKHIYDEIIPLKSRKEINKKIRYECWQYVEGCIDTSTGTGHHGICDAIIFYLVQDGYAKRKED